MEDSEVAITQNHALIANHLNQWADRVFIPGNAQILGFTDALRDVAAHLRNGDYAPGGNEWNELIGR